MCVAECFGGLGRVTHHKDRVRMRQNHRKEVDLALNAANHTESFTKISLGMSWRMDERYKHLLRTLAPSSHVILHDRNPARETVLVSEPLKNAPGRMSLLFGAILICRHDRIDNAGERIQFWPKWGLLAHIPRRHRKLHHLRDRSRIDTKTVRCSSLANPFDLNGVSNPCVKFHCLHPSAPDPTIKRLYLPHF
jgi:hypothetical protein